MSSTANIKLLSSNIWLCKLQEGKVSPKSKGPVGGSIHHSNSLAEGVRNTLRRNAASHPDLVRSGGSEVVQPPAESSEPAEKVRHVAVSPMSASTQSGPACFSCTCHILLCVSTEQVLKTLYPISGIKSFANLSRLS